MANLKLRSTTSATDPGSTSAKGSALTHAEMDSNFILLQTDINGKISSASPTLTGTAQIDNNGILQFNEATANGSNYVQIKTPAAIASNYVLTLPPDDGTSGQVLTTDGSGVLTFTDKTALTGLDIDGFTDGTSITVAATDKLLISDATAEKKINASQMLDYVETGITMTGDLTSTAGATALGATTMSGQLNLAAQEVTGDDTLTAPDVAHENDITSVSQNGTVVRVNASDNDTSNTSQAGLFFDQASGRMNFQLIQDLTGAHSGHSSVGGSGIIHPSLSFQTRDDGSSSTRAAMDLMVPYRGGTGATLTSSSGATGKICDVNTSKRIVYLQDVSGTWAATNTTAAGQPVEGTIDAVVSIGTDAVALQYNSSGFTNNETEGDLATLGKVRISTKDVMNGRGIRTVDPRLDIEAGNMALNPSVPTGTGGPGLQFGWNSNSTGGAAHIKSVLSVNALSDDPTVEKLFNEGIQVTATSLGDGSTAGGYDSDFGWPTMALVSNDKHGALTSPNTDRNTQNQAYGNVWFIKQNKDQTNTTQAAVESNQILGGFFAAGSHDSSSLAPTSGTMFFRATEDFTVDGSGSPTANGTRMEFAATANGDTTPTVCLDLNGDSVVINEENNDVDFIVDGDTNDAILKVDANKEIVSTGGVFQLYAASGDPSSNLVEGQMYFNSSTKKFMGYNGTAWVVIGTQS